MVNGFISQLIPFLGLYHRAFYGELHTFATRFAHILCNAIDHVVQGQCGEVEQVLCCADIEVEACGESVVESRHVDANVEGLVGLPLQILVTFYLLYDSVALAVIEIVPASGTCRAVSGEHVEISGKYALVARCTVAGAKFQVVEPLGIFHEAFIADNPACRHTGKPSPLVVLGEGRAAVVAQRGTEDVAVEVGIAQTAEEGELVAFPAIRINSPSQPMDTTWWYTALSSMSKPMTKRTP